MVRVILIAVLAVALKSPSYGACNSPHYDGVGTLKSKSGLLKVVLSPKDFTVAKLICLSGELKKEHPEWQSVSLLIFTSKGAAKDFSAAARVELPVAVAQAQSQLHAIYSLDRDKREEYLDILPFGWRTELSDATRIHFPVVDSPHCRFEIRGRCLYALSRFQYPAEALKSGTSGTITMEAKIGQTGSIANIRVESAESEPGTQSRILIDAAKQDFSSWHLEPREREDSMRVVWRYAIDRSLGHNIVDAKFESPTQVLIRGNP